MLPVIGDVRPWTDPAITAMHRLPAHVPIRRDTAVSLDGDWEFALFDRPEDVPADALTTGRLARRIAVPGNWTVQGVGDHPHYTNIQMPFPGPPPRLPERNPTGVYRTSFTRPPGADDDRVVLRIGGADSVHAVYVNGEFAGYGTDSRLPSEYDVTDLLGAVNVLAVVVARYSALSYVEDQDHWWMAGLHRSVELDVRPAVHLADVRVVADYEPRDGSGRIVITTEVGFAVPPEPGWSVRTTVRAPNGRACGRPQTTAVPHVFEQPYVFRGHVVDATVDLAAAHPWSAERPDRYGVTVELLGPGGAPVDRATQLVGVRRIEIRDRSLLVNGQRIWVFGVNRHDHHPDRGKAVTVDDIRRDLEVMRAHNITAVRTSHYPNAEVFYDLCDELGMYVIDEANVESHAYNTSICDDDRYRPAFLERGSRMVRRDRNHPCIVAWSLGNESGYGANHEAMAGWIRRADPSRPLHYEGAVFHEGWVDGGRLGSDLTCPMYPPIESLGWYAATAGAERPFVMCEYSHAMGNSNGSLADYWDVITSNPGLQGGFIWEWKDHGIRIADDDGAKRLAVGGDFGETPHDGNFVADGLVSAECEPHPAMREVAWVYRPVTVERQGRRLRITNRQSFTDLRGVRASWELLVAGRTRARGRLDVPEVLPHGSALVDLPCAVPAGASDVQLSIRWHTRRAQWFAPAGHLVAWDQVELRSGRRAGSFPARRRRAHAADDRRCALDDLVTLPVELTLVRAPIDNDGFKLLPQQASDEWRPLARWRRQGVLDRPASDLVEHRVDRRVSADGRSVTFAHEVVVPDDLADLPRIGVRFALPARFDHVRWFGRGPHENYPDRNRSAMLGTWDGAPDPMPYLVPQEYGLRTDVRWLECHATATGQRVRVEAVHPAALHMSAIRHRDEELFAAGNAVDLTEPSELVVHIDLAHRGLGTASCGPDTLARYRVGAGLHRFAYRITVD